MNRRTYLLLLLDLVLIIVSIFISALVKNISFVDYIQNNYTSILIFYVLTVVGSVYFNKYTFTDYSHRYISFKIIKAHFFAMALSVVLMYMFSRINYSRLMFFLSIASFTAFDLMLYNLWATLKKSKIIPDDILGIERQEIQKKKKIAEKINAEHKQQVKQAILERFAPNVLEFLEQNISIYSEKTLLVYAEDIMNISLQPDGKFNSLVNLARVNSHRFINKYFEAVNAKLPIGGTFICLGETQEERKKRLLAKYPPIFNWIYYFFDFFVSRVFPRFDFTKRFYFFITKGKRRVISKAEFLGRLYSCGFKVVNNVEINGLMFVVSEKVGDPVFDMQPTYGSIIRLNRVAKNGKIIRVYKFRTMHPYSEYLQQYVYEKFNLQSGGKFKNDFRISTLGKIMRKLWIDEWPMFLNVFKGEMKIVGVRPLSRQYFSLYSKELQERRIKYKPGLVPPFYVDSPNTLEEIMASETKYFDAYDKHPLLTDIRYFFLSIYNIIFRKMRSN